jgi:hypothetical protein
MQRLLCCIQEVVVIHDDDSQEPKYRDSSPSPTEDSMLERCELAVENMQELYTQIQLIQADIQKLKLKKNK